MWTRATIGSLRSSIGHRLLSDWCRCVVGWEIWHTVSSTACSVLTGVVTLESVRMTVLAPSGLRNIGHNLHTARNRAGRAATPGRICRSCWSSKALCELLTKCHSNIVSRNVNSISDTKNDKGTFSGKRKAGIRSVEAGSRRILDLTDTATTFPNNRANKDVRNQQAQGVGLGLSSGSSIKGFIVQCADD